mgnify:CR=1 FL=1
MDTQFMRDTYVSIHAPTRGATYPSNTTKRVCSFNPRTHEGCDCINAISTESIVSFNPRTHEGCDYTTKQSNITMHSFNPRTHEGCDVYHVRHNHHHLSFNPRTHEGCDKSRKLRRLALSVSIHAPTRGATSIISVDVSQRGVSIHAPTRGATQFPITGAQGSACFNPRTHEGCDKLLLKRV